MYLKLLEEDLQTIKENLGTPFYVFISLSNICNANCVFCNVHDEKLKHGRIDVTRLIGELKALGTHYIHFIGGGEPFTEKRIWDYFEQITHQGMGIAITTNGLALDYDKIQALAEFNVKHIFFSLDGHLAQIHNGLRRVPGLWEKVTENIRSIKKIKPDIKIVINHLLNKNNINYFENMLRLKESVPFDYINPLLIKDCPELYFSKEQVLWYTDNIEYFYKLAHEVGVKYLYDDINFFEEVKLEQSYLQQGAYHIKNYSCYFPMLSAYIDCPTAKVFPCDCTIHRDPEIYQCGNLIQQTFNEIWSGEKMENLRQKLKDSAVACKLNCDLVNIFFNECVSN